MDKDLIVSIVGELYLTNHLLTRKLDEANEEIEKLRLLVKQLSVGPDDGN